jgi:hypothetical protein
MILFKTHSHHWFRSFGNTATGRIIKYVLSTGKFYIDSNSTKSVTESKVTYNIHFSRNGI